MERHRARIALYLTIGSILLPLFIQVHEGFAAGEPVVFMLQGLLLIGIASVYWFHALMFFIKQSRAQPTLTFSVCLKDFFYPFTLLVVVSVLFVGFFNIADALHNSRVAVVGAKAFPYAARFGVAVIEVFPETQFPLGVGMYAFWGAFIFNNFNFIHRVVTNDFVPRVPILATLRVVAGIFAAIVVYFAFFPDTYDFSILRHVGSANVIERPLATPGNMIIASFFAGLFPFRTMRMVTRWFYDRFSQTFGLGKYTYTPLTVIDGVTAEVEERLIESAVDSINALATATVAELKDVDGKHLPYPDATLAEWIDQAKLAQYFYDEKHFAVVRSLGIRTYSAMQSYQKQAQQSPAILDSVDPSPMPKDHFRHFVLYGQFP